MDVINVGKPTISVATGAAFRDQFEALDHS